MRLAAACAALGLILLSFQLSCAPWSPREPEDFAIINYIDDVLRLLDGDVQLGQARISERDLKLLMRLRDCLDAPYRVTLIEPTSAAYYQYSAAVVFDSGAALNVFVRVVDDQVEDALWTLDPHDCRTRQGKSKRDTRLRRGSASASFGVG